MRSWSKGCDRENDMLIPIGNSANFDRQASATNNVSFIGLSPPKAWKTVSFFVSFH
jgi:hypothetical protein